jgi:hypothetical protein
VGAQDELGKLRAQLALCERLNVRLMEGEMRQAIEDYESKLEARLWLLLIKAAAFPASPW